MSVAISPLNERHGDLPPVAGRNLTSLHRWALRRVGVSGSVSLSVLLSVGSCASGASAGEGGLRGGWVGVPKARLS